MHLRITSRDEAPAHYAWASHIVSIHDKALELSLTPISSQHFIICFDDVADEGPDVCVPEMSHLRAILEFTKTIPDYGRVLLHCHAGISRSTAVAIAVLIQHGMDYREALAHVQKIRDVLLPNYRIVRLIDEYFGLNGAFMAHFEAWRAEQFRKPETLAHLLLG